ncbi:type VI secretion system contractile sheath small subunit [Rosenbergiella nectarea]|uniref:type VI secretion system contractile sheath small subunit n=1 Tax=Rosenbergiella nectarea TaxID=988801 RepID=UPI001BDAFF2D|nr:type VI secretion system contractile sheath small subunit [Rosenbergiella nectarea]MBT0729787.1 type VI secretion system contractile sheath small subunit [Rosenbergiella nectarea subsp. apis]
MSIKDSQKFIARNRAPRVQIEYDVEIYGDDKKVNLPFVMGVMSDLSGKSKVTQQPLKERKFLSIDMDNFDDRMKALQPRVLFNVENTLGGEGQLLVDLTLESLSDFSPENIAKKVTPLAQLLEARTQLANLQTYMDGKSDAESLVMQFLNDPDLLTALASLPAAEDKATSSPLAEE